MDREKLKEIRELVDNVIYSRTKKDAQAHIRRLKFVSSNAKAELDAYIAGKLGEVVSYAEQASGQVKYKEHWISNMERSWYVFEMDILNRLDLEETKST